MAYMIQDEDGDGIHDETGQKLSVNQIMNQRMLQELMKSDMYDFMPEDVLQFTLTAQEGSVSFFESFEWEEPRRITAFYQVLYEHDESHIDPNNAMTVMLRDPEKTVQYKQTLSDFGFIDFNSTVEGEYEFTFFNPGGPDKRIYLAVHFHNLLDESIPRYDIDETGTRK